MELTPVTYLIVLPLVFLAGFVDSVAGGGGIISLPAYLMAGIPAHLAAGTNKVVNGTGTLVAALKYFRSGKVLLRPAVTAAVCALIGSAVGTELAALREIMRHLRARRNRRESRANRLISSEVDWLLWRRHVFL